MRIFGTNLEHLDEGNAEIEVGEVAADQAQAEEEADRDNRAKIDLASHLNRLPAIEQCSVPSKDLGHNSREDQVVGGQNDRKVCIVVLAFILPWTDSFSAMYIGLSLPNPFADRIHLLNRITDELIAIQMLQSSYQSTKHMEVIALPAHIGGGMS